MSTSERGRCPVLLFYIRPVSARDICLVPSADICPVSAVGICPVSTEDICLVSATDIKAWLAEAATAADKSHGRGSLACGGRESGRLKSFRGALDDPSLATKQNRHRHIGPVLALSWAMLSSF